MDFAKLPIKEFYRHCLSGARSNGYKWVVSLLARDADVEGLYQNLRRAWYSLDSITGEYFLFVVAGKENHTHEERWSSKVLEITASWVGRYNDYVSFLNKDTELTAYMDYDRRLDNNKYMRDIEENQTKAVNSLMEYFSISEENIPCLVFTSLQHMKTRIVPIRKNANDIYAYFKELFNQIEPRLNVIRELDNQKNTLSQKQQKVSTNIKRIILSGDEIIFALYEELTQSASETGNSDLLDCITNKTYGKFKQPLRSQLNKLIDLIKNYEKNNNQLFNPYTIPDRYREKIKNKSCLKIELLKITNELISVNKLYDDYFSEIENIIKESVMINKKNNTSGISVSVTGGNPQIITALDEATVHATQNNGLDIEQLSLLIDAVRRAIHSGIQSEDIDTISEILEVIESEAKQDKPRKAFLKTALKGLQTVKGTAEFGAAVATLIQFVQTLL